MAQLSEAVTAPSQLGSDLQAGVDSISSSATVTFTKFVRFVSPFDGMVFWLRADLMSASALYNANAVYNTAQFNEPPHIATPAPTAVAKGSLHHRTDMRQDEDHTFSINRVVFTSEQEITDFNQISPNVLFIGTFIDQATGDETQFAFSELGSFYEQSSLWHYRGAAVYSDMIPQLINNIAEFTPSLIISNSLPAWLALNNYASFYGFGNSIPLYPSYLAPTNLVPPFATVHIYPESTQALSAAPILTPSIQGGEETLYHSQICQERVRITLWGLNNNQALGFLNCVLQYSRDYNIIGIINLPTIRDEKRTQVELAAIAQKKTMDVEVTYNQATVFEQAVQYITSAIPTFIVKAS